MPQRVLLIDNYDSFTFNLRQLLEESGDCSVTVFKNDALDSLYVSEYDKIIVSPGPGIPSQAGRLMEVLRHWSESKPILGVCLGHQAIAQCFGGAFRRTDEVSHGTAKTVVLEGEEDPMFQGIPSRFSAGLYHSWAVDETSLPDCLRITARSTDGVIMALAHRTLSVKGVQFHPESVMTPDGPAIIRNWLRL